MSTYSIAEVGRLAGFTPSTLRYYEKVGLLPPADRTESGYRAYDDGAVARLRFIARAKQLGCTLDEIADLVVLWDGRRCEPVQSRLRHLVDAKIDHTRERIADLRDFTAQLQEVGGALDGQPADGPCDDGCGCTGDAPDQAAPDQAAPDQAAPWGEDVSIACSLGPGEMLDRVADWRRVLRDVARRQDLADGIRLTFAQGAPIGEIAALTEVEQRCCSFFRFALTVDGRGTALEVRAPDQALALVEALLEPVTR